MGLATDLKPLSTSALAKAIFTLSLPSQFTSLGASAKAVAIIGCSGCGGWLRGLIVAVLVVLIADRPGSTVDTIWPIAPGGRGIVQQLLAILDLTAQVFGNLLVTVVVLHAVLWVGEETVRFWASEVKVGFWILAWAPVTVTFTTVHHLRVIAPLVLGIIQIVFFAEQVTGTTIVTLPIPRAVVWVSVEVRSLVLWAVLSVREFVVALCCAHASHKGQCEGCH